MDKILQINYQGRSFSIEEKAYQDFQEYESLLKDFFLKEEGGDEIFSDLQFRMAEILEQSGVSGKVIGMDDIQFLKNTIGTPSEFGSEDTIAGQNSEKKNMETKPKKLFRDKKEKIIAGVCGGIANYFAIDPLAVRVIFILFTIFNIATLFALNLGILAYIVLWIILKPQVLEPNIARKLFRNPKDQVLGGVCAGIAEFFNAEAWIIRLIFVAPILLGIAGHQTIAGMNFRFFGQGFSSLSFIIYMILWFITPLAKANTDFMLLKGEPINLSTIQHSTSKASIMQGTSSGLRVFLKIVAYIFLACLLMVLVPSAIAILGTAFYSYSLADIILFSPIHKMLAIASIVLFFILPIVALLIWLVRRVMGYKSKSRFLRIAFVSLHTAGWIAFFFLLTTLIKEHNTYSKVNQDYPLNVQSDTLYIRTSDSSDAMHQTVFFELNQLNRLIKRKPDVNEIKAVRLHYKESNDSIFKVQIQKSSFGPSRELALANAEQFAYNITPAGNILYIDPYITCSNKMPYHLQNVLVTIYYPKGKTVITSKELKNQLTHNFRAGDGNFLLEDDGEKFVADEINSSAREENENTEDGISEKNKKEELKRINQDIQETNKNNLEDIKQKQEEIEKSKRELEELERKAKRDLDEAQQQLNKTMEKEK